MPIARIAVLISGRGSNLAALLAAERAGALSGSITAVIANRSDAGGLHIARRYGVATSVVDHGTFAGSEAFDAALASVIDIAEPDLVVMAGFMRIVGAAFIDRY